MYERENDVYLFVLYCSLNRLCWKLYLINISVRTSV